MTQGVGLAPIIPPTTQIKPSVSLMDYLKQMGITGFNPAFNDTISPQLQQILSGVKSRMEYDPTEDYKNLFDKMKTITNGPSPEQYNADLMAEKLKAMQGADAALKALPVPQEEEGTAPEVSPLVLPNAPNPTARTANPLASLAAGIAGIVDPQSAGSYGAAALQGALQHAQDIDQQNQQSFQNAFRRQQALHEDELRRADMQQRVDSENRAIKYQNSIEQRKANMQAAMRTSEEAEIKGTADVMSKFARDIKPVKAAEIEADTLKNKINQGIKSSQSATDDAIKVASQMRQIQKEKQDYIRKNQETTAKMAKDYYDNEVRMAEKKAQIDSQNYRNQANNSNRWRIASMYDNSANNRAKWRAQGKDDNGVTYTDKKNLQLVGTEVQHLRDQIAAYRKQARMIRSDPNKIKGSDQEFDAAADELEPKLKAAMDEYNTSFAGMKAKEAARANKLVPGAKGSKADPLGILK